MIDDLNDCNAADWRRALPQVRTLQRYFKDHGWFVGGAGKIFHHHLDWAFHDNASFHEYLMLAINEPYPDRKLNGFDWLGSRNTDWGVWPDDIRKTPDYRAAAYAVEFLQRRHDQPFFLNVGIYKPHSPFFAPQEYFDRYPKERVAMPEMKPDDWADLPAGARTLIGPINRISGSGRGFWNGLQKAKASNPKVHEDFVRAYLQGNHAVRTERWRYIRCADGTEELYDHARDPQEHDNLAARAEHAAVIAEMKRWLPATDAPPASDFKPPARSGVQTPTVK